MPTLTLPADSDVELLSEFLVESREQIANAETHLLALEQRPEDADAIGAVFRAFHTIKGVAGFLGLDAIVSLAHKAESLLARIRNGEVTFAGERAHACIAALDGLRQLIEATSLAAQGRPAPLPADLEALERRLVALTANVDAAQVAVARPRAAALEASAEGAPAGAGAGGGNAAAEAWVRVRTDRLDRMVDMVSELVIASSIVMQGLQRATDLESGFGRDIEQQIGIVRQLQSLAMSLRMVPLRGLFQRAHRVVRDTSHRVNRPVEFVSVGEDTELDRNVVEALGDPLVHMLRNAIDHGLEPVEERQRLGKPAAGTVRLHAFQEGGAVVVQLSDDGRGMDPAKIRAKAISRGIIPADVLLDDAQVLELIFQPGFSTAEAVTDLSGRGVGMDVVRRNVEALKGRVEIQSTVGVGSTFTITLPLTLAILDGMLVRAGGQRYVIPTASIETVAQPSSADLFTLWGRGEMLRLRERVLPIYRLNRLFGSAEPEGETARLVVVMRSGSEPFALQVDELLGQQQVVAKSIGTEFGTLSGVSGAAILGDGRVGLIVDPAGLASLARKPPSLEAPCV